MTDPIYKIKMSLEFPATCHLFLLVLRRRRHKLVPLKKRDIGWGPPFGEYLHVTRLDVINSSTSHGVNPRIVIVGTNFARSRGLRKMSRPGYRRFQESRRSPPGKKRAIMYIR